MSKNIKSIAQNNIGYTGVVRLSQYTCNKKFTIAEIHNEGGKPLFDFLADCLVGNFTEASANMPTKISLLYKDDAENYEQAEGTSFIYLLNAPERVYNEKEGVVRYSFIIPQEYFAGGNPNSVRFNAIGLYCDSTDDINYYAARCDIPVDDWSISISSVLVLDWELHIANNFSNQEGTY
jgi:hypothetical protein